MVLLKVSREELEADGWLFIETFVDLLIFGRGCDRILWDSSSGTIIAEYSI